MALTRPRAAQIYDIDYKQATRVVTVSNITLTAGAPSSVDGVSLSLNDRILVTGQSTASQNGIYYVTTVGTGSNGTWARSLDTNSTGELLGGTIVMVTAGAVYADTQWKLTTDDPITIGSTALTFVQNYSANSITAGTSNVSVTSNANVTISSAGTPNVLTVSSTGTITSGTASVTGNVTGGNLNATVGVRAVTGYFTGNVDVLGNLNATVGVVYANSGIFNGNTVTGNNAAFAGVPGFTSLGSNVVMQFAGNVNSYSQINFENINNGSEASTDFIATAANGNDSSNFIDIGIGSGTYAPVAYPAYGPNDAYLLNNGGNLLINSQTASKVIKFLIGGSANSNIIATVASTGIAVTGIVSASGNVTGGNVVATTALTNGNITITGANIISTGSTIYIDPNGTGGTDGNVIITGNLSVTGNATYINSNNITTNDLTINVANNAATAAAANGGGIGVGPANAEYISLTYNSTSNIWVASNGLNVQGILSASGNVTGGNISATNHTGTTASITGNIYTGNILTNGYYYANGVAFTGSGGGGGTPGGANTYIQFNDGGAFNGTAGLTFDKTTNALVATGNITGGNISATNHTGTNVSVTGTVTAASTVGGVITGTSVSVTGNISTGTGNIAGGNATITTQVNSTSFSASGNIRTAGTVSATGAVTGASVVGGVMTGTSLSVSGAVTAASTVGGVITGSSASVSGTVTGSSFSGAGTGLTGTAASLTVGAATSATSATTAATVTTAAQPNITSTGTLTSITTSGGITATGSQNYSYSFGHGNWSRVILPAANNGAATGDAALYQWISEPGVTWTGAGIARNRNNTTTFARVNNLLTGQMLRFGEGTDFYFTSQTTGNVNYAPLTLNANDATIAGSLTINGASGVTAIINGGTTGVGNIGASGAVFNTIFAKATSAQYADLAEMYSADDQYCPGTVVEFGGTNEVTISTKSHSPAVAGIISTNPSYLMNSALDCDHPVEVALTGRVPCQVVGTIRKGDRLVASNLPGVATVLDMTHYEPGCIIGKALEDYNSIATGIIEVAVGRF